MWFDFAIAVISGFATLYLPGFLILRAFHLELLFSFSCAPLFSILGYCVLAIAYPALGIHSSWLTITVPVLALSLACWLVSRKWFHSDCTVKSKQRGALGDAVRPVWTISAYLSVGVLVTGLYFLTSLNGADSFVPTYDNVFHYNLAQSFSDSGNWSVLTASVYLDDDANSEWAPLKWVSYYPACWHLLCAMLSSLCSVPITVSANAVNFLVSAAFFPVGMLVLMTRIFPKDSKIVVCGALLSSSFCMFPGVLLDKWPLYPNSLSLALTFPMIAGFLLFFEREESRRFRVAGLISFGVGVLVSVFTQPNAVFTASVFLIPFCVYQAIEFSEAKCHSGKCRYVVSVGSGLLALVGCVAIWTACYMLPFLQSLVQYYWSPVLSIPDAILNALNLSFIGSSPQGLLAVLVVVGVAGTVGNRRFLWLTASYLLACFIFIVAASMGDEPIKHYLAGFWYTDPYRVAAFAASFAIPLASIGLYKVLTAVKTTLADRLSKAQKPVFFAVAAALICVFSLFNFSYYSLPGDEGSGYSAFGEVRNNGTVLNNAEVSWVYDAEEIAFVEEALEVIPEGSLVINQPFDGSLLSFGINNMNTYYRRIEGYGEDGESSESVIIRSSLNQLAQNESVKHAVDAVGAEYLLILERGVEALDVAYPGSYEEDLWVGIDSVVDTTEGFEVVLEHGDMRLYRIVG